MFLQDAVTSTTTSAQNWTVFYTAVATASATVIVCILGWLLYRKKHKGEAVQAQEKGKQEQIHTSELQSALDAKIEENQLKRKTISVTLVEDLLKNAEKNAKEIQILLQASVESERKLSQALTLVDSQEQTINRLNGIIENQWTKYELTVKRFGLEEQAHADCLEMVKTLETQAQSFVKQIESLTARVKELEKVNKY